LTSHSSWLISHAGPEAKGYAVEETDLLKPANAKNPAQRQRIASNGLW